MKIFDQKQGWSSKVNFVDDNNVFVGYDMAQDCCEHAGWCISDKDDLKSAPDECEEITESYDNYNFDRCYFKQTERTDDEREETFNVVTFKLAKGEFEKFLHLFNCHNGYYRHGFTFGVGGSVDREGDI